MFESGYKLNEFCPVCGLAIRSRDPDTWFFMYGSTAAITGVFILLLFALRPVGRPDLVRVLLVGGAIVTFLTTMPARKSLAVAFDYWLEARS